MAAFFIEKEKMWSNIEKPAFFYPTEIYLENFSEKRPLKMYSYRKLTLAPRAESVGFEKPSDSASKKKRQSLSDSKGRIGCLF